jgi:hypothetical protein
LLKEKGDTLVVRSPEKAGVGGSTPSLATIIPKDLGAARGFAVVLRHLPFSRTLKCMEVHFTPEQEAHLQKSPPSQGQTPSD